MSRSQITDAGVARAYILAGDARTTLVSRRTGTRYTYEVRAKRAPDGGGFATPHFVAVLTGPDNTRDYQFLGSIFDGATYRHGRKSQIAADAPSAKAWAWVWSRLAAGTLPAEVEVWHEGRCGRCGRALTDPASIASGIGPVCADAGM